jgi:hypothetical protein
METSNNAESWLVRAQAPRPPTNPTREKSEKIGGRPCLIGPFESWAFGGSAYRTGSDANNIANWTAYRSNPPFLNNMGASTSSVEWPAWTANIDPVTLVRQ